MSLVICLLQSSHATFWVTACSTEEISIVDNFKDDDMYDELLDELETDNKSIH